MDVQFARPDAIVALIEIGTRPDATDSRPEEA